MPINMMKGYLLAPSDHSSSLPNAVHRQDCMQTFCKGGRTWGNKKRGAQLQAASGGALEDYVKKIVW